VGRDSREVREEVICRVLKPHFHSYFIAIYFFCIIDIDISLIGHYSTLLQIDAQTQSLEASKRRSVFIKLPFDLLVYNR